MGYAGGTNEYPTYYHLGDHSESIEITYDPAIISYRDLIDIFWQSHNPAYLAPSRQYRSFVFYHNEEQKTIAVETRDAVAAQLKRNVVTEIVPAGTFWQAEDYHQKYYLTRQRELHGILQSLYPDSAEFIMSTVVARFNGYMGGNIGAEDLVKELEGLGIQRDIIIPLIEATGENVATLCPVPG